MLFGVVGHPVAHSLSPRMQAAAFAAAGVDARYVKLPVPPELFEETARALPGSGYRGVNVTIPHKRAALRLADDATPTALAVGAANTLTFDDGRIEVDNTDARGFLEALDTTVEGSTAVVLGAGGAARAVVWALKDAGAAHVLVWNRTEARARALAADFGVSVIAQPQPCDLLVNATSVGLHPQDDVAQLGLDRFEPPPLVADLVYGDQTPVAAWASAGGARVVDGREMLVRQGALSFERWTGREAPLDAMRRALRG